jgi:uncharacterized protein (TIGR01440 family)
LISEVVESAKKAAIELCDRAGLKSGQTVVIGCSTSEIVGHHIGTESNADVGKAVFDALSSVFRKRGVYIAAQCCEHLNRAIVIEQEIAAGWSVVNCVPISGAGGAFAAAAYSGFAAPVCVEEFRADAGLDIGGTLIGMHLKRVAVPLRLEVTHIGKAALVAARVRPPMVGGKRTVYDESLI